MQHRTDRVLGKKAIELGAVAHIAADEGGRTAGDLGHALQGFGRTVAEVVEHHHLKARLQQRQRSVGADVASAAGDQNALCHVVRVRFLACHKEKWRQKTYQSLFEFIKAVKIW